MRTYWGIKAIVEHGEIVDIITEPEAFTLVGEMSDGSKVYEDENKEQFFRRKVYGKFVFIHI